MTEEDPIKDDKVLEAEPDTTIVHEFPHPIDSGSGGGGGGGGFGGFGSGD